MEIGIHLGTTHGGAHTDIHIMDSAIHRGTTGFMIHGITDMVTTITIHGITVTMATLHIIMDGIPDTITRDHGIRDMVMENKFRIEISPMEKENPTRALHIIEETQIIATLV